MTNPQNPPPAQISVVPAGYMIVPIKPSREMVKAGESWSAMPEQTWTDMIDAAPVIAEPAPAEHLMGLTEALVRLADHGVPADLQEVLVNGSVTMGVRPGALAAVLPPPAQTNGLYEAALDTIADLRAELAEYRALAPNAPVTAGQGVEAAAQAAIVSVIKEHPMGHWTDDQVRTVAVRAVEAYARSALAHQPLSVPEGWQPIETAPRDGTEILGYGHAAYHGAKYAKAKHIVWWNGREWCGRDPDPDVTMHPYSWQPLPAAPKYTGGGETE